MKTLEQCIQMRTELLSKFKTTYPIYANSPELEKVSQCEIIFNPKMRTTAGRAHYRANKIELNVRLLTENPDYFDQTFVHELAHLISFALFKFGTGHGRHWKNVMYALGYTPHRTHKLDTNHLKRSHPVVCYASCNCRNDIKVKPRRYRSMQNGNTYRCIKCKQRLKINENNI